MSKYLLLVLINLPVVTMGIVRALTRYHVPPKITKTKCLFEVAFWLMIGVGLIFVQPLYNALIKNNLTDSAPMSLFDVVILTLFIFSILLIVETKEDLTAVKAKMSRIHEKLAIVEAEERQK